MLDPGDVLEKIGDASVIEMPHIQTGKIKLNQEHAMKDYDENIEEKISLSQYYSHFIDSTTEATPQYYINKKSEPRAKYDNALNKNISKPKANTDGEDVKQCNGTKKKPTIWKCTHNCGKIFTQEKYMRNHIVVMHENISAVQCKVCLKYLSTKARLKNHMLRHSGVDHLVCLICTSKRASVLSCIRHHLFEKHGISGKHPLFHESYYEMSLKEISLMKTCKNKQKSEEESKGWRDYSGDFRKSANDVDELKWKIMEKSKRVKNLLQLTADASKTVKKEVERDETEAPKKDNPLVMPKAAEKVPLTKPQKILTAENGMKLVKLPNGHFKKITPVFTVFP